MRCCYLLALVVIAGCGGQSHDEALQAYTKEVEVYDRYVKQREDAEALHQQQIAELQEVMTQGQALFEAGAELQTAIDPQTANEIQQRQRELMAPVTDRVAQSVRDLETKHAAAMKDLDAAIAEQDEKVQLAKEKLDAAKR